MIVRWIASLPGVALALVWFHHMMEVVEQKNLTTDKLQHPWFVCAAVVSLSLFLLHLSVFLLVTCKLYRWVEKTSLLRLFRRYLPHVTYVQVEFYIVLVDLLWSILWLLQLSVQAAIPAHHQLYKPRTIQFLAVLYVCQVVLTLPLGRHLYRHQPRLRRLFPRINRDSLLFKNVHSSGYPRSVGARRR